MNENEKIKNEMNAVIDNLKSRGINENTTPDQYVGLGDVVESALTAVGITQDRFKQWFGLQECNCTERKRFLNKLFKWKVTG